MTDTPELNVWRDANDAFSLGTPGKREQSASAVIRSYGDQRYQAAIDDVVEWLGDRDGVFRNHDARLADEITRRFGKGQDHG